MTTCVPTVNQLKFGNSIVATFCKLCICHKEQHCVHVASDAQAYLCLVVMAAVSKGWPIDTLRFSKGLKLVLDFASLLGY